MCVCHLELSDLIVQGRYLAFHDVVEIELHIVPTWLACRYVFDQKSSKTDSEFLLRLEFFYLVNSKTYNENSKFQSD